MHTGLVFRALKHALSAVFNREIYLAYSLRICFRVFFFSSKMRSLNDSISYYYLSLGLPPITSPDNPVLQKNLRSMDPVY